MNRERVQMLRDMIAGIPQKKMNLNRYYKQHGSPCGTIACIAGWAAIYPPFNKMGFVKASYWEIPSYRGEEGMEAAGKFFGVPPGTFGEQAWHERGTHKSIALRRLDKLLEPGTEAATRKAK